MRSTTWPFAQWNLVLAHLQHSKFNIVVAQLHAWLHNCMRTKTFALCRNFLEGRLLRTEPKTKVPHRCTWPFTPGGPRHSSSVSRHTSSVSVRVSEPLSSHWLTTTRSLRDEVEYEAGNNTDIPLRNDSTSHCNVIFHAGLLWSTKSLTFTSLACR